MPSAGHFRRRFASFQRQRAPAGPRNSGFRADTPRSRWLIFFVDLSLFASSSRHTKTNNMRSRSTDEASAIQREIDRLSEQIEICIWNMCVMCPTWQRPTQLILASLHVTLYTFVCLERPDGCLRPN